eukprot:GHRR01008584.1.p2 GENE.GHRR01008584.1~~GHRR01008584.1.p2  ORF type:complete len:370 (+),score=167.55 GHRR01008584.1:2867-3976(+)
MVFGGGKRKEAEAAADRARKEVQFWKDQLDHAVDEKNALLERYTELYRHSFELEHVLATLHTENRELKHVLDRTLKDERRAQIQPQTPSSGSGPSTPDGRSLQHNLAHLRTALKQADVRIAILEERILSLQQDTDLLHKQNGLLRSSEAAYQKEAKLLRDELSKSRGINDFTADETTKLLLENSRLAQAVAAAQGELLHKDEVMRLLSAEVNELSAKLELCAAAGTDISWEGLVAAAEYCSANSNSNMLGTAGSTEPAELAAADSPDGIVASSQAKHTVTADAAKQTAEAPAAAISSNGTADGAKEINEAGHKRGLGSISHVSCSSDPSYGSAATGSADAAVEALAAALPLRLNGIGMLRASTQDRKGE